MAFNRCSILRALRFQETAIQRPFEAATITKTIIGRSVDFIDGTVNPDFQLKLMEQARIFQ